VKTMPDHPVDEQRDRRHWLVRSPLGPAVLGLVMFLVSVVVLVGVQLLWQGLRPTSPHAVPSPTTVPVPQAGFNPLRTPTPDFDIVVRQLADADNFLHLHPDPARVGDVYDQENLAYAEGLEITKELAAGDLRYDPLPQAWPIKATHLIAKTGDSARVTVDYTGRPAYRVVDRAGNVVVDKPASGPVSVVWTLKYRNGQWRILATERV
jgi:hypothetical protein